MKESPQALLARIEAARNAGKPEEARAQCEALLAQAPDDGDAWMWAGILAMDEKRWAEGIDAFERALKARMHRVSLLRLGVCYGKINKLADAHHCLQGAVALAPKWVGARVEYATVLHGLRRFEEALEQLDAAHAIDPEDDQVDLRRGCTLAELGRYDEAQAAFERSALRPNALIYARLVKFDRRTFDDVTRHAIDVCEPLTVLDGAASDARGVVLVACNPPYARKYGRAFLRSYAAHAPASQTLHFHIVDDDDDIVDDLEALADAAGVRNLVVTVEKNRYPQENAQQRKSYYACSRFVHITHWLERYRVPVLVLDIDMVIEAPLDRFFDGAAGRDVSLNLRTPINAPWLDVVANVVLANPTAAAKGYFAAVGAYALLHMDREPTAWLVDQSALYCVLRMFERFAAPPAVHWLSQAHENGLWHIGSSYDHLLDDPRFTRFDSGN